MLGQREAIRLHRSAERLHLSLPPHVLAGRPDLCAISQSGPLAERSRAVGVDGGVLPRAMTFVAPLMVLVI